ncbi:ubiquitin activating enzyme, putative [Trypanosoma brucei brucei TREU927]|uniref:NEDD8-activating enzyme E1 regulatory subunit n=1 Tax=Trypanosoma brucei brucei (strain 927/4 GUTat10.1) TaxID=185431 RepID=Q586W2_TRYB2|nr:ubiquitin activating enzyme, putative [Trypanosoma brucei brucei TREU927]AAQ15859.1 ubiquitin activating enzyme, putative [Trypanosoma brucei brucei TREU927]AAX79629.1 ubiquitin activating enzyme, putative [Trypanosoma brucei]
MSNEKYDRQLRLWGHAGQMALAESHVVVLGATATAVEMLKNMILPGLGFFTLVDGSFVDADTLGNNYFVELSDYAARKPLSEVLVKRLCELNPHSSGTACVQSCVEWSDSFISSTSGGRDFVGRFPTLIVATPRLPATHLRRLADHLKSASLRSIPLMYVQTCGLSGIIQIQDRERLVVHAEPKQEMRVADLRLFNPFPELRSWLDAHDPRDEVLYRTDPAGYGHLPWIAMIYHALQCLRCDKENAEFIPCSKADYDTLRTAVSSLPYLSDRPPDGVHEAMENCRMILNRPMCLSESLEQLLRDPRANGHFIDWSGGFPVSGVPPITWAVLYGINRFIAENNGVPPFCGFVPDINTTTQWYRELRSIYNNKMEDDCCVVQGYAMEAINASNVMGGKFTSDTAASTALLVGEKTGLETEVSALTRSLVQNIWTLQLTTFSPSLDIDSHELLQRESFERYLSDCVDASEQFTVMLYAALLGARCFEEMFGRWPGLLDSLNGRVHYGDKDDTLLWMSDGEELIRIVGERILNESGRSDKVVDECLMRKACMEVARCGCGEPFPTAGVMGAAAAQECIKLLQHRRVPIQRPLVFDGYRSCFWVAEAQ